MKRKRIVSLLLVWAMLLGLACLPGSQAKYTSSRTFAVTYNLRESRVYSSVYYGKAYSYPSLNDNTQSLMGGFEDLQYVWAPVDGYYGFILVGPDGGAGANYTRGGLGGVVMGYIWLAAGQGITCNLGRGGQHAKGGSTTRAYGRIGYNWTLKSGGQGNDWAGGGGAYACLYAQNIGGNSGFFVYAGGGGGGGSFCITCGGAAGCTTPANANKGGNAGSIYATGTGYTTTINNANGRGYQAGPSGIQSTAAANYPTFSGFSVSIPLNGGGGSETTGGAGGSHSSYTSHGMGFPGGYTYGGNASSVDEGYASFFYSGGGGGGYYGGGGGAGTTGYSTHKTYPLTGGGGGGSSYMEASWFTNAGHAGGVMGIESPFVKFLCAAAGITANTANIATQGSAFFDSIRTEANGCAKDSCFILGYMGTTVPPTYTYNYTYA